MKPTVARGELGLHDETQAHRHTLVLSGELDLATAPTLEATFTQICSDGAEEVVLDLRGLEFIDSSGLRTILHGIDLCERHGCRFALIRGSVTTQRLFEITGLLDKLPFRDPEDSE